MIRSKSAIVDLKTQKPRVFIGSSQEALKYAKAIKTNLQNSASVNIWNEDIWTPGGATLENLIDLLPRYDFAVLILAGEDITLSRGKVTQVPRDNIIFELGLFMGHLGRFRTFFLRKKGLKLPSDLDGINYISFEGTPGRRNKSLVDACETMRQVIVDQGVHEPFQSPQASGHVGEAVFKWMNLSEVARKKLARSQFIGMGGTKETLMTLVNSAKRNDSILAICGYKGDFSSVYYQQNFKKCKAVSRVFSYQAVHSEITEKNVRHALDGLKMHLNGIVTAGCDVEVILVPKDKFIKDLGGRNFDPPLSFGLAILLDGNELPKQAVVHWEMDAEPLKHLIAIEGVIIDDGQQEMLRKLVGLWEAIARSDNVLSSKKDKNKITALCNELEEFWIAMSY